MTPEMPKPRPARPAVTGCATRKRTAIIAKTVLARKTKSVTPASAASRSAKARTAGPTAAVGHVGSAPAATRATTSARMVSAAPPTQPAKSVTAKTTTATDRSTRGWVRSPAAWERASIPWPRASAACRSNATRSRGLNRRPVTDSTTTATASWTRTWGPSRAAKATAITSSLPASAERRNGATRMRASPPKSATGRTTTATGSPTRTRGPPPAAWEPANTR